MVAFLPKRIISISNTSLKIKHFSKRYTFFDVSLQTVLISILIGDTSIFSKTLNFSQNILFFILYQNVLFPVLSVKEMNRLVFKTVCFQILRIYIKCVSKLLSFVKRNPIKLITSRLFRKLTLFNCCYRVGP